MRPLADLTRAQALVASGAITERRSCLSKCAFAVKNHALQAAKTVSNRTGREVTPYKCSFCAHWHLTKARHTGEEK